MVNSASNVGYDFYKPSTVSSTVVQQQTQQQSQTPSNTVAVSVSQAQVQSQQQPQTVVVVPQSVAQSQPNQSDNVQSAARYANLHKILQTELTCQRIHELETQMNSELESRNNKIEEMTRANEEFKHQVSSQQKLIDQQKLHINKCLDVVKKLLKEKSRIEKKEARQKCMQNRLRLGQFITQRVGATYQENWTDGHAFQELTK